MFRDKSYLKTTKNEKKITLKGSRSKTIDVLKPEEHSIFSATASKVRFDKPNENKAPKRRAQTSYGPFRPKVEFFNGTFSNFGKDAPKIGIGSSRKDDPPPPNYPGPGTYDLPVYRVSPLASTIPKARLHPFKASFPRKMLSTNCLSSNSMLYP